MWNYTKPELKALTVHPPCPNLNDITLLIWFIPNFWHIWKDAVTLHRYINSLIFAKCVFFKYILILKILCLLYLERLTGNESNSKRPFWSNNLIISSSVWTSLLFKRKYLFFQGINWKRKSIYINKQIWKNPLVSIGWLHIMNTSWVLFISWIPQD